MAQYELDRRKFIQKMIALGITLSGAESLFALAAVAEPTKTRRGPRFSQDSRIAIVGAGASGISASHFLREKGYQSVTLFEATDHIGGKCNTVDIDGKAYDMGAVFTTSSYDEVMALAQKFDVPIIPLQSKTERNIVENKSGRARGRTVIETAAMGAAVADYFRALSVYPELAKAGFANLNRDLCASLSDWMKLHCLFPAALDEFFGYTFTPFGYGFSDEVPAAYALKYYEERLVSSLLYGDYLGMLKNGYQSLWKAVAKDMEVKLSTPVLKVKRFGQQVQIDTHESSSIFDHLILTCLPEDSLRFLDTTTDEQIDFQKTKRYFYHSIAVEIPARFSGSGFLPGNYYRSRSPHPLCWFKRWHDGNIAIFYALSKTELSEEAVIHTLMFDSEQYGWNLGKVRASRKWKYFPHFESKELTDGIYDRLENRQGQNNTYLAGEIMNFSTVEMVTRYSKSLVQRFF